MIYSTLKDMENIPPERKALLQMEPYKSEYEAWRRYLTEFVPKIDNLLAQIAKAFAGVKLGNGMGLQEAEGIDLYKSDAEINRRRATDEKEDWKRIPIDQLKSGYSSLSYFDAKGFLFHLPAFLSAELAGKMDDHLTPRLINPNLGESDWVRLTSLDQRETIISVLRLIAECPAYREQTDEITQAIQSLRDYKGN